MLDVETLSVKTTVWLARETTWAPVTTTVYVKTDEELPQQGLIFSNADGEYNDNMVIE